MENLVRSERPPDAGGPVARPILYEFPHSHFCEIARWALDYKRIAYRSVCLLPGLHVWKMKRLAGASSVPVLVDGGEVVRGSGRIVDYLDRVYPDRPLTPAVDAGAVDRLEREIARTIGVPLRRLCYYHLLPNPDLVRYFFMHRSGVLANLAFSRTRSYRQVALLYADHRGQPEPDAPARGRTEPLTRATRRSTR
jgi:hypothetical protein